MENAAVSPLAFHPNPTLMLFHDAINGRQAQAGAFALGFGGKKRFKNALERIFIHALAGVTHGEAQAFSTPGVRLEPGGVRAQFRVTNRNGQSKETRPAGSEAT